MDWSDAAVQFGSRHLDRALKEFCEAALSTIQSRSLELLNRLRASRATLYTLRQVNSADIVSGKIVAAVERTSPVSVMTPLDDKATTKVKGYLRRRIEKFKSSDGDEFRSLVPQTRESFEKGFDAFVERCIEGTVHIKGTWFEEHVLSGAAQPQLWKIYVAFQRQLRDACDAESRKPLPPPLFKTKKDNAVPVSVQHRQTLSQSPVAASNNSGHTAHSPHSAQHHYRTQSCQDFGRCLPSHPHGFHGLVSVPCVIMPSPYHITPGGMSGLHSISPIDFHRDYAMQCIAGLGIQDDNDLPYVGHSNAMFPVGFHVVRHTMDIGDPTNTVDF